MKNLIVTTLMLFAMVLFTTSCGKDNCCNGDHQPKCECKCDPCVKNHDCTHCDCTKCEGNTCKPCDCAGCNHDAVTSDCCCGDACKPNCGCECPNCPNKKEDCAEALKKLS